MTSTPAPSTSPQTLFLDNNAISYLFGFDPFTEEELKEVRARLDGSHGRGEVRVLLTLPLLEEIAGAFSLPHYASMVDLAWRLSGGRVLRPGPERRFGELAFRRKLTDDECYYEPLPVVDAMRTGMLDATTAKAMADHARTVGENGKKLATRLKAESEARLAKVDPDWRARLEKEMAEREKVITEWAMFEMGETAKLHGLQVQNWPDPKTLPTFWYNEARLILTLDLVILHGGSTTSKRQPGIFDWLHFEDCAYADVLVTEDERFERLAKNTGLSLRVLSFTDWAREMLR